MFAIPFILPIPLHSCETQIFWFSCVLPFIHWDWGFYSFTFQKKFKTFSSNFVNFETFKMVKVFSYNVPLSLIGIPYHLNDNYIVNILVHFLYALFHLNSSIQNSCWLPNINTTYWIYNINNETPQLLILFLYAFTFF